MTLSVLVPTRDPAPRIAALLAPLREVADEFVIAVDHRVELDRLGAYEQIADRLLRFEPSGRDLAPGWMHRQCSSEWVLTLAGDEVPSAALVAALPALCADPAIRQYWLPVRWVWPDPEHWLDELPWAPDFHNRLLRNDDHLWFERPHASGAWPVLPARYVEAPVYHLDGVLLTEAERAEKVQRYAALRPGLVAPGGGELNERYYLPERHARLPLAAVPPADRARARGGRGRAARRRLRPRARRGAGRTAGGLRGAPGGRGAVGGGLPRRDPAARARPPHARGRDAQPLRRGAQPRGRRRGRAERPAAGDPHGLPVARRRGRRPRPRRPPHPVPRRRSRPARNASSRSA